MSPMWLTSKTPTPVRTAKVLLHQSATEGYSTGMSQPLKSTILAPNWRWTAFKAVCEPERNLGLGGQVESFSAQNARSRLV